MDALAARRVLRCSRYAIDPAIDRENTFLRGYLISRAERDLVLLEGVVPQWVHVTRMRHRMTTALCDAAPTDHARLLLAFRACVVRVETPAGPLVPDPDKVVQWGAGGAVAGEEWLDRIEDLEGFGYGTILEFGQVALDLARLAPGADGPFGIPPGLGL